VEYQTADQVAGELGDLMFMAIFLAHLYGETEQFQMDQVLRRVGDKMIHRHPHVFGNSRVESASQVKLNWEELKSQERPSETFSEALEEIPRALPALMRSYRLLSRLARRLRRPLRQDILRSQLRNSLSGFLEQNGMKDDPLAARLIGKMLLLLVAVSLPAETVAEEALTKSLDRFSSELERLEAGLTKEGRNWEDVSEAEERTLWENL
jgi:uncharacterized protein YabN with tetrapyrrole methylase and pyrophosphatase domain